MKSHPDEKSALRMKSTIRMLYVYVPVPGSKLPLFPYNRG